MTGSGEPGSGALTDDGAGYVDAATVALRHESAVLERSSRPGTIAAPVTPRSMRDAMGCLATGVCVVTSFDGSHDVAMTANSVTSVSLEPPLVLVCVARAARFHGILLAAGIWGLSVLDATSFELSSHFARPGRDVERQLQSVPHHRGGATGVALLDDCVAEIECTTEASHEAGDHTIVVGRVVSAVQTGRSEHPLLFHRGRYRWLL